MPSSLSALPLPFLNGSAPTAKHLHVVLPYAAMPDISCQHWLQKLSLPNLEHLLRHLPASHIDQATGEHTIAPHERVLASAWGLSRQQPAWASLQEGISDTPSAWLTPCHWTAGADQVRMDDPASLHLNAQDAQTLLELLQPWFLEDGLTLRIVEPHLWCVSGSALAHVQTASLDRVVLRDVTPWLPSATTARQLHRLHSEVQMLLYNHEFNAARQAARLQPINAFWLHGAGQLSAAQLQQARSQQAQSTIQVVDTLRQSALRQDWQAWQQAWQHADAGPLAALRTHIANGGQGSLSLCGELHARSFQTAPRSISAKLKSIFSPQRFADLHQAL